MVERFSGQLRDTVKHAEVIARSEGSATIEAEHLLRAIVEDPSARTRDAVRVLGLTTDSVGDALRRELDDALRAVGVVPPAPPATAGVPGGPTPRWGQSAKLALERTVRAAAERGERRLDDRHLLLGITRAEEPTAAQKQAAAMLPAIPDYSAAEDGDSIRFTKATPFGPLTWTRGKSELTADERATWERQKQAPAKRDQ